MQKNFDYNKFFSDLNIAGEFRVEEDLGNGFVKLKISEAERRQALQDINSVEDIIVELLRNSRDAGSSNVFVATKKIAEKRRLIYCIDDGSGIPVKFHNLIFQSRVTSKLEDGVKDSYGFHGRGMALFSVKLNVEDIRITFSDIKKGTCVFVDVNLDKIPEKKDQSLAPKLLKSAEGYELSGGVNNILKIILEFAVHNPGVKYYYGSPTSIISTLIGIYKNNKYKNNFGDKNCSNNTGTEHRELLRKVTNFRDFEEKILSRDDIPVTGFTFYCENYDLLDEVLRKYYNMNISLRSLQRLGYGEIAPLKDIIHIESDEVFNTDDDKTVALSFTDNTKKPKDLRLHDEVKLANRFKDDEIQYIINYIEEEIKRLGKKYFITLDNNIELKKANNTINFMINLKQKD